MSYQNVFEDMNRQAADGELARQRVVETILELIFLKTLFDSIVIGVHVGFVHENARR